VGSGWESYFYSILQLRGVDGSVWEEVEYHPNRFRIRYIRHVVFHHLNDSLREVSESRKNPFLSPSMDHFPLDSHSDLHWLVNPSSLLPAQRCINYS